MLLTDFVAVAAKLVEKGSMRILSKEFPIMQHFGGIRDIPLMMGMIDSPSTASMTSEMSDSLMMESTLIQTHGSLACSFCCCNTN